MRFFLSFLIFNELHICFLLISKSNQLASNCEISLLIFQMKAISFIEYYATHCGWLSEQKQCPSIHFARPLYFCPWPRDSVMMWMRPRSSWGYYLCSYSNECGFLCGSGSKKLSNTGIMGPKCKRDCVISCHKCGVCSKFLFVISCPMEVFCKP